MEWIVESESLSDFVDHGWYTISSKPLVRCKDCKLADWYKTVKGELFCYCMETGVAGRTEDDYCSYGERKDG